MSKLFFSLSKEEETKVAYKTTAVQSNWAFAAYHQVLLFRKGIDLNVYSIHQLISRENRTRSVLGLRSPFGEWSHKHLSLLIFTWRLVVWLQACGKIRDQRLIMHGEISHCSSCKLKSFTIFIICKCQCVLRWTQEVTSQVLAQREASNT